MTLFSLARWQTGHWGIVCAPCITHTHACVHVHTRAHTHRLCMCVHAYMSNYAFSLECRFIFVACLRVCLCHTRILKPIWYLDDRYFCILLTQWLYPLNTPIQTPNKAGEQLHWLQIPARQDTCPACRNTSKTLLLGNHPYTKWNTETPVT